MKSVSLALQSPTCVTKTLVVILLISGTARIDRVDPGTENVKVEVLQKFLGPTDATLCSFSGGKSFVYGKSTANLVKIMTTKF